MADEAEKPKKPELFLLKKFTPETLLELFRKLTGREPSPEEIGNVRRKWEEHLRSEGEEQPPGAPS